jgi:signal recognition particle subunit SRP68
MALDPSNVSKAAKLRHSATSRFRRAVNWSTQLLSLCQALYSSKRLSAENLLELTVYTLILNGRFLRARDEFQDALVQLSVARNLLDNLAQHATRSRDQALAVLFADDIGAEIRYCAHQLGHQKAYDVDGIVKEISEKNRNELVEGCNEILSKLKQESEAGSKEASRKNLATLMWEGQPVPVRNPELVDVLLKVQEADAKVENAKGQGDSKNPKGKGASGGSTKRSVAVYDGVLLALSDAEDVARKLVEAQQVRIPISHLMYIHTKLHS